MNYPADCVTISDKAEWLQIQMATLNKYNNIFARWFRVGGITQQQYDVQPAKLKDNFDYYAQLPFSEWKRFLTDFYEPRLDRLVIAIGEHRAELKDSTRWTGNTETI